MPGIRPLVALLAAAGLAALPAAAAAAAAPPTVPGQLIVGFSKSATAQDRGDARAAVGAHVIDGNAVAGAGELDQLVTVAAADARPDAAVMARQRGVRYVEPVYRVSAGWVPDDSLFGNQWGLLNVGQAGDGESGAPGADIHVSQAWDITRGAGGPLVGVVDTGVDFAHPDLQGAFWTNTAEFGPDGAGGFKQSDGTDHDGNTLPSDWRGWNYVAGSNDPTDDQGHGTATTGVIAARADNGQGVAGVDPGAQVVEAKALGADGTGTDVAVAAGMGYAASVGARVVNVSIVGPPSQPEADAIAAHPGTLFVVAAGNDGRDIDSDPSTATYPCADPAPNVLCVGATDRRDNAASFSNTGKTSVDLMAPGQSIWTTTSGGGYGAWSGTSFAAPMTAGVAALLFAAQPQATAAAVKQALMAGTDPVSGAAAETVSGGRLDAYGALRALGAQSTGAASPVAQPEPAQPPLTPPSSSPPPPAAPQSVTAPEIAGDAVEGATLTASPGSWATPVDRLDHRWLRCLPGATVCTPVPGATATSYPVGAADQGESLVAEVIATNAAGSTVAVSRPTVPVAAAGRPVTAAAAPFAVDRRASADRRGLRIRIACRSAAPCAGELQVLARSPKRLADLRLTLAPGRARTVTIRLALPIVRSLVAGRTPIEVAAGGPSLVRLTVRG